MRIPTKDHDGWELALTKDRQLPPIGAVTYLVRFHRNVPVLRLDMDVEFWRARVLRDDEEETLANESWIFEHLDYASHDQRSFGYPYPLKAGHDRASLTQTERSSFRRQIIDAAVSAGMKRSVFRDASMATGHK
jgi:NurA-like 5'-3' nuclease